MTRVATGDIETCSYCSGTKKNDHANTCEFCGGQGEVDIMEDEDCDPDDDLADNDRTADEILRHRASDPSFAMRERE